MIKHDVVIIGSGPCGIATALKLKEAGVDFLILEKSTPGGKVNVAPRVDNYPGQVKIPGPDLAVIFYQRLLDKGISLVPEEVISLTKENDEFVIKTNLNDYVAKIVVIASGTKERKLNLPLEDELFAKGISYCAICDGHFFKDKTVLVVGGGNSAIKEAIYLADIVKKLYVVHRRNAFRASDKIVDELKSKDNVEILTPYIPNKIYGKDKLEAFDIEHVETHEIKHIEIDGLFPLVGQLPNTEFINIVGVKDEYNLIPVDKSMMSSCPNLYAGGDVLPRDIRQIYLSEHDGMVIAKNIIESLNK